MNASINQNQINCLDRNFAFVNSSMHLNRFKIRAINFIDSIQPGGLELKLVVPFVYCVVPYNTFMK